MRTSSTLPALLLLAAALAGCAGDGGTPSAVFVATAKDAQRSTFLFDASGSKGDGLSYTWDFGDGNTGQGKTAEHAYEYINGDYMVTLAITGKTGLTASVSQKVTTGTQANQPPVLCLYTDARLAKPGQDVVFDASMSYDGDGEPLTFAWDFNYADPDEAKESFTDQGHTQYGHNEECVPGGATSTEDDSSGGHVHTTLPLADPGALVQHLRDQLPLYGGDHGPSGPEEEFNAGFDGTIDSEDAIQVFQFPSPATYYVVVRASDPKGSQSVGFIRVMIDAAAPANVQSAEHTATLHYGTEQAPAVPNAPVNKTDSWSFPMQYPGTVSLTISFTTQLPSEAGEVELQGWLCTNDKDDGQCKSSPTKAIPRGTSPIAVSHTFVTASPGTYRLLVENVSPTFDVEVTEKLTRLYDTNPWYGDESGVGGGHDH